MVLSVLQQNEACLYRSSLRQQQVGRVESETQTPKGGEAGETRTGGFGKEGAGRAGG